MKHISVLLTESVDALNLHRGDTAIDATVGVGGHAERIAQIIGDTGRLLALDVDEGSLQAARERLKDTPAQLILVHGNFKNIKERAQAANVTQAQGILFDLGWHAAQLEGGRGLSFREAAPLSMSLGTGNEAARITAADIIAGWDQTSLENLFRTEGERFAGRIARAIVESRSQTRINSSDELARIVESSVPGSFRRGKIHPATKVFQALRIAVNDEYGALAQGIEDAVDLLVPGGRLAIITFHSNEDRIVKRLLLALVKAGKGRLVVKKPITPTREEAVANRRARSAKLRIFERYA
ncbi:MAG: 16S rRNA (cytosine(1402)-N(4))-methyltransferase RsmH [Patescibacteria group bacterium]